MGIAGLLPLLKSVVKKVHLSELAGKAVAIDAYSWLHKGVYGRCAMDLFQGLPTEAFVDFCMAKIELLLHHNVTPIMVFDGGRLPIKSWREAERHKSRSEAQNKVAHCLAKGDKSGAHLYVQKATDITPEMAARLIQQLIRHSVEYVVAPYEADAQMAWLCRMGLVEAIITEDSDLLLFGCRRVLFKLDRDGYADEISHDRIHRTSEIDISTFTPTQVRDCCQFS